MKLIPAQRWTTETFPEGGVGPKTVEKWIKQGVIYGRIIGTKVFVDADRTALLLDQHTNIQPKQVQTQASDSTNPVDQIVAAALAA